jgi:hypothetical protein
LGSSLLSVASAQARVNAGRETPMAVKDDSDFDPIRDEPAFKELIGR